MPYNYPFTCTPLCSDRQVQSAYLSHQGELRINYHGPGLTSRDSHSKGLGGRGERALVSMLKLPAGDSNVQPALRNTVIRMSALYRDYAYLFFALSLLTNCPVHCLAMGLVKAQKVKPVKVGSSQYMIAHFVE